MDEVILYQLLLLALVGLVVGIVLLVYNKSNKKNTGKTNFGLIIPGWALVSIAIIASIVAFILYINKNGGMSGLTLFIFISPIFIIGGFIFLLSYGISTFVKGCTRDEHGLRNKEAIVRGAFMMFLSVAVIVSIITSVSVLMHNYSSANGDKPVMGM